MNQARQPLPAGSRSGPTPIGARGGKRTRSKQAEIDRERVERARKLADAMAALSLAVFEFPLILETAGPLRALLDEAIDELSRKVDELQA